MIRQGSCYEQNGVKPSNQSASDGPGVLETFWAYVRSGRAADDLMHMFNIVQVKGELSGEVGKGPANLDAKIMPVLVPDADNFTIFDFRNVLCAGSIQANMMDVHGQVMPGDNSPRKLLITE
jgi:hypothetical protein